MILVQISDTHLDKPGHYAYRRYDTGTSLRRAIAMINAITPQPDLVLHTGDVTFHATAELYELFRQMMSELDAPWCVIPGNHDDRLMLRAACADTDWMPQDGGFQHYVVETSPLRIICCDSVMAGEIEGELCPARLAWLAARLDEAPAQPTIIAMHHPPFASGMTGASRQGLARGGAELASLLRRHPQVIRLIAGHVHRPITTLFGDTIASTAPTTCYPFGLDMGSDRVLRMTGEPPAFAVHVWLDDAGPEGPGLVSHIVPIGDWPEPIVLKKDGKRLLTDD